jgi:DNA-binding NarL/FixJ family response regulator
LPQTDDEVSIVVVEDDAMVRDWLRDALEGSGFRVGGGIFAKLGVRRRTEAVSEAHRRELL